MYKLANNWQNFVQGDFSSSLLLGYGRTTCICIKFHRFDNILKKRCNATTSFIRTMKVEKHTIFKNNFTMM